MTTVQLSPGPLVAAELSAPLSKSDAHRALLLNWIVGDAPSIPAHFTDLPTDVRVVLDAIAALSSAEPELHLDCRDAGAPFRFLLTQAALTPNRRVHFSGTPRLAERPLTPLLRALSDALGPSGVTFTNAGEWPLILTTGAAPTAAAFAIDGSESSQFVSSVLLGAARLSHRGGGPIHIAQHGERTSDGYTALTVDWMRRAGFDVSSDAASWTVRYRQRPDVLPEIPADWSSAGYLLALAWHSGGSVRGIDLQVAHPDRAIVRMLQQVGLTVTTSAGATQVRGRAVRPLTASGKECPDLLPTLAAIACVLPAPSTLEHASILTLKESDRRAGIIDLVRAVGGDVESAPNDGLRILPPTTPRPFRYSPRHDHRLAMSAAVLAALTGVAASIDQHECVSKSFPAFFAELAKTGMRVSPG